MALPKSCFTFSGYHNNQPAAATVDSYYRDSRGHLRGGTPADFIALARMIVILAFRWPPMLVAVMGRLHEDYVEAERLARSASRRARYAAARAAALAGSVQPGGAAALADGVEYADPPGCAAPHGVMHMLMNVADDGDHALEAPFVSEHSSDIPGSEGGASEPMHDSSDESADYKNDVNHNVFSDVD